MRNILPNVKIIRLSNAAAAGTTDINGTAIDMQGYEGALCIAALGTLTSTQVTKLLATQSDDNGSTDDFTQIATTSAAADADSNKLLVLEVYKPNKRYVRFTLDRGSANAVLDSMVVILYGPDLTPTTAHSTISAQAFANSPSE